MSELIRPRLIDHYSIAAKQAELQFAIPFLHEDIPLYVDPFLLWRSPSQQDRSLHDSIMLAFNRLGWDAKNGRAETAAQTLIRISECDEVGLGNSVTRRGKRLGRSQANAIVALFERLPNFARGDCQHIEEMQLFVDGVAKDRISDIACNYLKSFLIDFTMDEASRLGIPLADATVSEVYDQQKRQFIENQHAKLPINPADGKPLLFVPKRWLRHVPWINFDEYFKSYCPQDDIAHAGEKLDRVEVLRFNRDNYGSVEAYVAEKERTAVDCANDPLFTQIPNLSAKRHLVRLRKLPTGMDQGQDREYELLLEQLLPSLLYPHLDFAAPQSRTESGVSIRDLIFYNSQQDEFLRDLANAYQSRQIPFEMKNVRAVERENLDQLNRYLTPGLGHFGVLVTRNELPKARMKQAVDLWSGQRKVIVTLTDDDIALMVELFESKQRLPIEVLKKKYIEFRQKCPG